MRPEPEQLASVTRHAAACLGAYTRPGRSCETPAKSTGSVDLWDSSGPKATTPDLRPAHLLGPPLAAVSLMKEPEDTQTRLLNVVIDPNHILVVPESLDEEGGLLQVGVGQLHLRVGDELQHAGHGAQAQGVQLLPYLMQQRDVTNKLGTEQSQ